MQTKAFEAAQPKFYASFIPTAMIRYGSFTPLSPMLPPAISGGVKAMLDAIFLIVTTILFVLLSVYAYACDKL